MKTCYAKTVSLFYVEMKKGKANFPPAPKEFSCRIFLSTPQLTYTCELFCLSRHRSCIRVLFTIILLNIRQISNVHVKSFLLQTRIRGFLFEKFVLSVIMMSHRRIKLLQQFCEVFVQFRFRILNFVRCVLLPCDVIVQYLLHLTEHDYHLAVLRPAFYRPVPDNGSRIFRLL